MAVKASAKVKKAAVPAKKAAAPAKKAAAAKTDKGDYLVCDVCGFAVIVDEICGCVETHEILCCSEPMKKKAAKAKPKAKVAAKK
jgi:hypothetical protein